MVLKPDSISGVARFAVANNCMLRIRPTDHGNLGSSVLHTNSEYSVFSSKSTINDVLGLTKRLLRDYPESYTPGAFDQAINVVKSKARCLVPMTENKLLSCYSGAKLGRYQAAANELQQTPLERKHFVISSFVKRERYKDTLAYPRMVHHRSYMCIFEMLRYIKPIEHKLYKMRFDVENLMAEETVVAKGANGNRRYELISAKMSRFKNPCVFSLDCSSFELHTDYEYLKDEVDILRAFYPHDKYWKWITSNLFHNFGHTSNGVTWARIGGRVSGDAHTGLANTLAMIIAVLQLAINNPHVKMDFLSDGDDTLLFFERGTLQFGMIQNHFRLFGHELRLDKIAYCLEDVLFCQHRFLDGCMIRSPKDIIDKALVAVSNLAKQQPATYYAGIGKGLRAVYGVIPEIMQIAEKLISLDPTAEPTSEYWLKHPQKGSLEAGRVFDIFDEDMSAAASMVEECVNQFTRNGIL